MTIDEINCIQRCGGPALYSTLPALLFGWQPHVIGTIGRDISPPPFSGDFVILSHTIRFRHQYIEGKRVSYILSYPNEKISADIDTSKFDIIIVNPVFDEFDHDFLSYIVTSHNFVGVDIQGFVRQVMPSERISITPLSSDVMKNILRRALVVKASREDLYHLPSEPFGEIFIITLGDRGAKAYVGEREVYVPVIPVTGDPTGAGDVFLTTFMITFYETRDLKTSLIYANALASLFIEGRLIRRNKFCIDTSDIEYILSSAFQSEFHQIFRRRIAEIRSLMMKEEKKYDFRKFKTRINGIP